MATQRAASAQGLRTREIVGPFNPAQRDVLEQFGLRIEQLVSLATQPRMRSATVDAVHRLIGKTTDDQATEIFVNGNDTMPARLTLPEDTTWVFHAYVVARRMDQDDESAGYEIKGVIDRNTAGSAALVGSVTKTVLAEDSAAWDVTVDAASNALRFRVTGEVGKTIGWIVHVNIVPVSG